MFILSCERSGSTLLRYIVDTHPDIASPGELNLGRLCAALYYSTYYSVAQVVASGEIERSSRAIEKVRQVVSALMAEYTAAKGKRFWCDKSPANLQKLKMIDTVFPDAKYICLYRNCMDVVHSCLEWINNDEFMDGFAPYVRKHSENHTAAFVDNWTDKTRQLLAFERANREKCFRITYEAIVLDTVSTLKAMFEFLGLPFDPRLPDSVFLVHHDLGGGDPRIRFSKKINKHSLGKGSKVSRTNIPADLLEQMNAVLSELGYPTVGPDWDTAPSPYLPPETVTDQSEVGTTVEEIVARHLPALLKSKREKINALCKIAVNGEGGGNWIINLAQQSIQNDDGKVKPDCIVAVSARDFIDIMSGRLNPMAAVDVGKLHLTGDPVLAGRIGMLLFGT